MRQFFFCLSFILHNYFPVSPFRFDRVFFERSYSPSSRQNSLLLIRQTSSSSLQKVFKIQKKKEKGKMLALRLARIATRPARRCLATATANHADVASSSSSSSSSAAPSVTSSRVAPIPLSNVEALWTKLSGDEKVAVHEKLEALQLKDWKTLSVDEKKAG